MKTQRGITLISLIITIIVMLILAGVSLSIIMGDGNIISKAIDASNKFEASKEEELLKLAIANSYNEKGKIDIMKLNDEVLKINGMLDFTNNGWSVTFNESGKKYEISESGVVGGAVESTSKDTPFDNAKKESMFSKETNTKLIVNKTENESDGFDVIIIPSKYRLADDSATSINKGIVITDSSSNEWVWVPVSNSELNSYCVKEPVNIQATEVITNYYTNSITVGNQALGSIYIKRNKPTDGGNIEPLILPNDGDDLAISMGFSSRDDMITKMVNDYEEMIKSIEAYGGFYIGRYELSANGVQKGCAIKNRTDWYGLYNSCNNLSASSDAKSRMIYGLQWDATCNWLCNSGYSVLDSRSWGNYSDSINDAAIVDDSGNQLYGGSEPKVTGFSEYWSANNIYDFAGNAWEWTQESLYKISRVFRGGGYGNSGADGYAACTNGNWPNATYGSVTSRPTLILNYTEE